MFSDTLLFNDLENRLFEGSTTPVSSVEGFTNYPV